MKLHKRNQNAILAGSVLFALAAGLSLPGCGSSDPTKKYPVAKDAVPPGQAAQNTDVFDARNIFNLDALTPNMYFYEGKESTFYFKPNLQIDGVNYTIGQTDLPPGEGINLAMAPDSDTEHKGLIALNWTPKYGTLGESNDRTYKFNLVLLLDAKNDPTAVAKLSKIQRLRPFSFTLLRSLDTPTYVEVGTPAAAAEGKRQSFSIVVKDVSANGNRQPSLVAFKDKAMSTTGNIPTFDVSTSTYVIGEAQAIGGNQFKFTIAFDGSSITMPPGAGPAQAHVLFRVNSAAGVLSLDKVLDFKVARKAGTAASADASSTTPPPPAAAKPAPGKGKQNTPRPGGTANNGGGK